MNPLIKTNKRKTTPDVERLFGASIQPEIFPPGTLRIPTKSCEKEIKPTNTMLALYKIEPTFPDALEIINEFKKISSEFKIEFGESEVPNG